MFLKLIIFFTNLHHDENGDIPVGTVLLITFIVLPLIIMLVYFKDKLIDTWKEVVETLFDNEDKTTNPDNFD